MEVWFNPSCSKSRAARDRLEDAGIEHTLRRYLDEPPTEAELRETLAALRVQPWEIARTSDPLARELGVADLPRDPDVWVRLLAAHPALIQRPIVLAGDGRAWVARDDETLREITGA